MWSPGGSEEPSFDDVAQLLRWSRAERISLYADDVLSFDDDLFAFANRRTRPHYKTERPYCNREWNE